MPEVATIDFHVTCDCNQECPYCWGPQDIEAVDTTTALAIVSRIAAGPARRIVFTGGDPLKRPDIGLLIRAAKSEGLEVALSTTGDELNDSFLAEHGSFIDLISLPLDGASDEISSRTKKEGHFAAVMGALGLLACYPGIDVKVATPVTRHNLTDVPNIATLLDRLRGTIPNRLFYNVFQAYPRSMTSGVDWRDLVVTDIEFRALRDEVTADEHRYPINWLSHETLDKLYVMVFPDGSLSIPSGSDFGSYGDFLAIPDIDEFLRTTDFDAPKHQRHAATWTRTP
ncbi:MAG: radical SAM protein [Acidimicrobiia bacterium]|nr:radical SAM protein [Acidimicrobiia bacterium]MDH5615718.1 radical SAM protein [Acidimicrobiia bacterium]